MVLSIVTSLAVAWTISIVFAWRIAVVLIALQPITITCFCVQQVLLNRFAEVSVKGQLAASQVAGEAVSQLRTITALSAQDKVLSLFRSKIKAHYENQLADPTLLALVSPPSFSSPTPLGP